MYNLTIRLYRNFRTRLSKSLKPIYTLHGLKDLGGLKYETTIPPIGGGVKIIFKHSTSKCPFVQLFQQ